MNRCKTTTRKNTRCTREAKRDGMCTQHAGIEDRTRPTLTTMKAVHLPAGVVGRGMKQRRIAAGWALVNLSDGNYADQIAGVGNRYPTRLYAERKGEQIETARRERADREAAKTVENIPTTAPRGWSIASRSYSRGADLGMTEIQGDGRRCCTFCGRPVNRNGECDECR